MRTAFLHSLTEGMTPTLLVIGVVMFGAWTVAYYQILTTCFRQKTYGLPMACVFLDISWEFLFAFQIVAPLQHGLAWGNRLWFFADCVIVAQVFMYGRESQRHPWVRRHFHTIAALSLAASFVGLYLFQVYFRDVYGVASSFLINLLLSVLFIQLLLSRPDLKGLPYGAAWSKMIGSVAGAAFCYLWWPMQFDGAGVLVRPPHIQQPPTFYLLYFLYASIFVLDLTYIHLYRQQRAALRGAPAAAAAYQPVVT
jgi:hypothetical protein